MSVDSTTFRRSRVFNASRDHLRAIKFRGNLTDSNSKPEYLAERRHWHSSAWTRSSGPNAAVQIPSPSPRPGWVRTATVTGTGGISLRPELDPKPGPPARPGNLPVTPVDSEPRSR
jgi:hypothetical protein